VIVWTVLFTLAEAALATWPLADWLHPRLAVAAALWAGLRAERRSGVLFALMLGAGAGLFTADPWALAPLGCVLASTFAAIGKRTTAVASRVGFWLVAVTSLCGAAVCEMIWRAFMSSSKFTSSSAVSCALRLLATALVLPWIIKLLDRSRLAARS
jgi:hypothetical protein